MKVGTADTPRGESRGLHSASKVMGIRIASLLSSEVVSSIHVLTDDTNKSASSKALAAGHG